MHTERWTRRLWLAAAGGILSAQTRRIAVAPPTPFIDSWPDTEGRLHSSSDWRGHALIAIFFVTTDCPITNSYVGEMQRLYREYSPRDVVFWAVHCDPTQGMEEVKKYATEYKYEFPVLMDEQLALATRFGARRMPEAVIASAEGKLLYRGRIDDRYVSFGKARREASKHDFREAMEQALNGKRKTVEGPTAVGCYIPFSLVKKEPKG